MMKFPVKFQIFFLDIFAKFDLQSREVKDGERITRFILFSRHLKMKIRYQSLLPPQNLKLSVYRTSKCDEEKIWWLGKYFVSNRRSDMKEIRGRGDFSGTQIIDHKTLSIQPLKKPHPRHADVIGWPADKDLQKAIAMEMVPFVTFLQIPQAD